MICNLGVVGSNPTRGSKELTIENEQWTIKLSIINCEFSIEKRGSYQSGQMGLTVTQLAYAFGGSNPSLPTRNAEVAQSIEH